MKDNRRALVTDVEKLTRVMTTINSERDSIDQALHAAPLALGNLAVAFNNETGSIGSRIGVQGTFGRPDLLLCAIVQQSDIPKAHKDLACQIFASLFKPIAKNEPASQQLPQVDLADVDPSSTQVQQYAGGGAGTLGDLIGGGG